MKKFITALALTAAFVPAAFAQPAPPAERAAVHSRHVRRAFAKLNLTPEQKQQIKAIRQSDRQQNATLYATFHAKATAYRQLRKANDPSAANAKADLEVYARQVKAARKAVREQISNVLTPEQRARFQAFRETEKVRREAWKSLGLTVDQKQQIKQIRRADFEANKAIYESLRSKTREYRQLVRANDPGAVGVKSELQDLRGQVKTARIATRERILGVLTPEQRAQLQQLRGRH